MKKQILFFSACFLLILGSTYGQYEKVAALYQNSSKRIATASIWEPKKSTSFYGTDSSNLLYSKSTFYYYDSFGNKVKETDFDTVHAKYIGTDIYTYDDQHRQIYYANVDTVNQDTTNVEEIFYSKSGNTEIFKEHSKLVNIDSAGNSIIDSNFIWINNSWKLYLVERGYYVFTDKKVTQYLKVSDDQNSGIDSTRILTDYFYDNGVLTYTNNKVYRKPSGEVWMFSSSDKNYYLDTIGSVLDSVFDATGAFINYVLLELNRNGNMTLYKTKFLTIANKYDNLGGLIQVDIQNVNESSGEIVYQRTIYEDFREYTITGLKNTTLTTDNFSVFPNPARAYVTIEQKNSGMAIKGITIKNTLGYIVYQSNTPDTFLSLDDYHSGLYFIEIQTDQGIFRHTIVKE